MNPTPSSAQALDSAAPPNEVQYLMDTSESSNDLGLSDSLTPLGEPITKSSAKLLAEDPLKWLQQYWLNISAVGTVRGDDATLLALGIEHTRGHFLDSEIENEFDKRWCQYEDDHREACLEQWERMTVESEEAKPYLRDIDRMMVQRRFKNSEYLSAAEQKMILVLRAGRVKAAQRYFNGLGEIYQKLEAWRVATKEEEDDCDAAQLSLCDSEEKEDDDSDEAESSSNYIENEEE